MWQNYKKDKQWHKNTAKNISYDKYLQKPFKVVQKTSSRNIAEFATTILRIFAENAIIFSLQNLVIC